MKISIQTAKCPSCKEKIYVGEYPTKGNFVLCKFCEEELKITKINPVILDWLYYPYASFEISNGDRPNNE